MQDVEPGGGASRTTEPALGSSSGTDVSLREYLEVQIRWRDRFDDERDRRYSEVQQERDKAEVLRAANQAYRDEKANELREQISSERGTYVTKSEVAGIVETFNATLKPLIDYVSGQQGARTGALDQRQLVGYAVGILASLVALYFAFN